MYVNADEIEKVLRRDGGIALSDFFVVADAGDLQRFLRTSSLVERQDLRKDVSGWSLNSGYLDIRGVTHR